MVREKSHVIYVRIVFNRVEIYDPNYSSWQKIMRRMSGILYDFRFICRMCVRTQLYTGFIIRSMLAFSLIGDTDNGPTDVNVKNQFICFDKYDYFWQRIVRTKITMRIDTFIEIVIDQSRVHTHTSIAQSKLTHPKSENEHF